MDASLLSLLVAVVLASVLAAIVLVLSSLLGPKRANPVKNAPFESGHAVSGPGFARHAVKFYLVAILFLVFDMEAVFIYPWAILLRESLLGRSEVTPAALLLALLGFVGVLTAGLVYVWRCGVLAWGREP